MEISKVIIVLETSGKKESVDYVIVKLFTNEAEAHKYCKDNTDDPMDEKYWKYCEIINEGSRYEIVRYDNLPA